MIRKECCRNLLYLPLGYRAIRKVENIVREEMDRMGGYEILMSALQPKEIWGRIRKMANFGPEMFKVKDRNEREFCLGPYCCRIFYNFDKWEKLKAINNYL